MQTTISVHPSNVDTMDIEFVEAHDHMTEGYFRLKFGGDVTVFLSDRQCEKLSYLLNNRHPK